MATDSNKVAEITTLRLATINHTTQMAEPARPLLVSIKDQRRNQDTTTGITATSATSRTRTEFLLTKRRGVQRDPLQLVDPTDLLNGI